MSGYDEWLHLNIETLNYAEHSGNSNNAAQRQKFTDSNWSDVVDAHAQCKSIIQLMQRTLKEYIETAEKTFTEYAIKHLNENDDRPTPVLLEVKQVHTKNKKLANKMLRELNMKLRDLNDEFFDCEDLIEKYNNQNKTFKNNLMKHDFELEKRKRMTLNINTTKNKIKDSVKRLNLIVSEVTKDYSNTNSEKIVVGGDVLSLKVTFGKTIKSVEDTLRINKALKLLETGATRSHVGAATKRKRTQESTQKRTQASSSKKQRMDGGIDFRRFFHPNLTNLEHNDSYTDDSD